MGCAADWQQIINTFSLFTITKNGIGSIFFTNTIDKNCGEGILYSQLAMANRPFDLLLRAL